jgi:hypothetical protein
VMLRRALAALGVLALWPARCSSWGELGAVAAALTREVEITVAEGVPAVVLASSTRKGCCRRGWPAASTCVCSPPAGAFAGATTASRHTAAGRRHRAAARGASRDDRRHIVEGWGSTRSPGVRGGRPRHRRRVAECRAAARADRRPRPDALSLEGFLFRTPSFAVGLAAPSAGDHMLERFREVWRTETAAATAAELRCGHHPWSW